MPILFVPESEVERLHRQMVAAAQKGYLGNLSLEQQEIVVTRGVAEAILLLAERAKNERLTSWIRQGGR